jgi:transposase-like protein
LPVVAAHANWRFGRAEQLFIRLRVVHVVIDTGITDVEAAKRHSISHARVNQWVKLYRRFGEAGLEMRKPDKPRLETPRQEPWLRAHNMTGYELLEICDYGPPTMRLPPAAARFRRAGPRPSGPDGESVRTGWSGCRTSGRTTGERWWRGA